MTPEDCVMGWSFLDITILLQTALYLSTALTVKSPSSGWRPSRRTSTVRETRKRWGLSTFTVYMCGGSYGTIYIQFVVVSFLNWCWANLLILIPQVTIVVLGNKLDKQDERRVDSNLAQNWAKNEKVRLWEVSVVDRRTLIEPFVYLASKMTQPQSKSTFPLSRNKNKGSGSTDSWMNRHCIYVQEGGKREKRCVKGSLVLLMINFDNKDRRMLRSDDERKGRMIVWIFIYSENCSYWHLYLMFWWNTTFLINE